MKLFRIASVAGAFLASAVIGSAMKNADVIKMAKAGMSDATIILAIGNEPADYDASPDALIELKNSGVSEAVIQKLVASKNKSAPAATAAAAPDATEGDIGGASIGNEVYPSIAPPNVPVVAGQNYFLRCTIHLERNNYVLTNYARGETVPINTPVNVIGIRGDKITVKRLDTGTTFTIENVGKYTGKSTSDVASMLLSAEKTPLEKWPADLVNSIKAGELRIGMNKEQAVMARGFPPVHETSSTASDRWVYWSSRFVKQTVVFANDRLIQGRMIR